MPGGTVFPGFQGFLDLTVGVPDPTTGIAVIDVTGSSTYLSLPLSLPFGGMLTLCIKPIVPVLAAGVVACNGGFDLGIVSAQDHDIGVVGVNGFTEQSCQAAGGTVEAPTAPHPGVCNGPVVINLSGEPDAGTGAVLLAPDARFGTQGLPAEVSIVSGTCDRQPPGDLTTFGFVSALSRAQIFDSNDEPGNTFSHDERGENFSCQAWTQEDGPGRLVLSVPAVHGAANGDDLITVFSLDD